jgi:ribulose-bisphosphate carboxylase large chain
MHVNGLRNKFCESDESVIASAQECLTPIFDGAGRGCEVMPVFSSGQWAGQAFDTYAALGSADLIHAAGGGIIGHPGGIAAGAASMRAAWEGAIAGLTADQVASSSPEFREAQEQFAR